MAIISQIRKRGTLIIAFVGLSLLLFILGDVVTSNTGLFQNTSDVVGVIGGEKVHYQEFEMRVDKMIENYKANTQQENLNTSTTDMLREQMWTMVVTENTTGKEIEKLGISCDKDELYDLVAGRNIDDKIKQAFRDSLGNFNPQSVVKFLNNLPNTDEKVQNQWAEFEKSLQDERRQQKYKNLIKGSLYVTTSEARRNFTDQSQSISIQYVADFYKNIPDSTVKVEESDIEKFYREHKNDFQQKESVRKVEFVVFDVVASDDDRNNANQWMNERLEEFRTTTDNVSFIARYSDTPLDSTYHSPSTLTPSLQPFAADSVGTIIGPYDEGIARKLAKITGERSMPDSVRARHILLKTQGDDTLAARTRIDSMKVAVQKSKGKVFEDLVKKFSEDQGSKDKGGVYDWFKPGTMVPEFNDACFLGKKGDLKVVKTQFGYHLIEVLDQAKPSRQIQVAVLSHNIEPSQATYDNIFQKASEFANKNNTGESFDKACTDQGLNKRIADNLKETDKTVTGLDQPRELVRWAYTAKKDDVSKPFTFGDKYVVAYLVGIKEKGTLPLDDVREQATAGARKEKKAAMLIEKFNKVLSSGKTIEEVAKELNLQVQTAANVSFSSAMIENVGREPSIVGALFSAEKGKITSPLKGESAVCIAVVTTITEAPKDADVKPIALQMLATLKQRGEYEVQNALKEIANIEDNRGRFY
jgi:peptidyl-prolyl cis-trans isomerase D